MVLGIHVVINTGNIFVICLVSSICVTVQSIHGEVWPVFTAALSRNLQEFVSAIVNSSKNKDTRNANKEHATFNNVVQSIVTTSLIIEWLQFLCIILNLRFTLYNLYLNITI